MKLVIRWTLDPFAGQEIEEHWNKPPFSEASSLNSTVAADIYRDSFVRNLLISQHEILTSISAMRSSETLILVELYSLTMRPNLSVMLGTLASRRTSHSGPSCPWTAFHGDLIYTLSTGMLRCPPLPQLLTYSLSHSVFAQLPHRHYFRCNTTKQFHTAEHRRRQNYRWILVSPFITFAFIH